MAAATPDANSANNRAAVALQVVSGIDVACRAVRPAIRLHPALVRYRLRLPPGPPRVVFANSISLLPGTLSCELGEAHVFVHVLDRRVDVTVGLAKQEAMVAGIYGLALDPPAELPLVRYPLICEDGRLVLELPLGSVPINE